MGKPQSTQESFLKTLASRSMSEPYVFFPDDFTSGRGTNEPADLVWACNNTVILMNMTATKLYACDEKNDRKFREDMAHNLGQASGWMKKWNTIPLLGENAYRKFRIERQDAVRIAVISIVKAGDGLFTSAADHPFCEVHEKRAAELGVNLCATFSQPVPENLIGSGGSLLDILRVAEKFRGSGEIPEQDAHGIVNEYREGCGASLLKLEAEGIPPELVSQYHALVGALALSLTHLRHRPILLGRTPPPESIERCEPRLRLLSDIGLQDYYAIAQMLSIATILAKQRIAITARQLCTTRYDYGICVARFRDELPRMQKWLCRWHESRMGGRMKPGTDFTYVMENGRLNSNTNIVVQRTGIEEILDGFSVQPPPSASSA